MNSDDEDDTSSDTESAEDGFDDLTKDLDLIVNIPAVYNREGMVQLLFGSDGGTSIC
jgi:hypothetical protein